MKEKKDITAESSNIQGAPKKERHFKHTYKIWGNCYFFPKNLLDRVYHMCGQMSKVNIYNPIIYDIALFQTLKGNYAVNGHEMYCTCVFFYLCVAHILTSTVTELPTVKSFMIKCNVFYIIILLYSI